MQQLAEVEECRVMFWEMLLRHSILYSSFWMPHWINGRMHLYMHGQVRMQRYACRYAYTGTTGTHSTHAYHVSPQPNMRTVLLHHDDILQRKNENSMFKTLQVEFNLPPKLPGLKPNRKFVGPHKLGYSYMDPKPRNPGQIAMEMEPACLYFPVNTSLTIVLNMFLLFSQQSAL